MQQVVDKITARLHHHASCMFVERHLCYPFLGASEVLALKLQLAKNEETCGFCPTQSHVIVTDFPMWYPSFRTGISIQGKAISGLLWPIL